MSAAVAEDRSLKLDWLRLTVATALFSFGFNMYGGVFQNYIRDFFHAQVMDLGILEALREVPGLLTSITAGILVAFAESRIAALGLAICAIGIGATTVPSAFQPLIALTMFWSVGFHLYSSMSSAIALNLAKGIDGGRHLGRLGGVAGVATIAALGVSSVISRNYVSAPYSWFFIIGGVAIFGAAVALFSLSHHSAGGKRQPIILRKQYGLFYLLMFLEGCRRQIFSIFASFALIQAYGQDRTAMLILQFVNAIMIAFTAAPMGRLIDKVGERKTLSWYAVGLIIVFCGYAFVNNLYVLYGLYLFDNVLFSFSIGFTIYLSRIVRPGELTPCVTMGVTMNHIAAVTVPVIGAYFWTAGNNYHLPFIMGVVLAAISFVVTLFLPKGPIPKRDLAQEELALGEASIVDIDEKMH